MPLAHVRGPGHPDALCDAMAIALVEEYLRRDPDSRTRLCVTGGRESLFVDGDVVSQADFDPAPILRKALAEIDPTLVVEPFLTCETVQAQLLPLHASFEPWIVYGYATAETPTGWPPAQHAARAAAQAIETARKTHPEGFLLGLDYELVTDDAVQSVALRMDHAPQVAREQVEGVVRPALQAVLPGWSLRFLSSGAAAEAGLRKRSGVSGRLSSARLYSSHIPCHASGIGHAVRHPANLGAWLARTEARRLVGTDAGRGVLIALRWDPFETRPMIVSARNERGDDLAPRLVPEAFDLAAPQPAFVRPGILQEQFRSVWAGE